MAPRICGPENSQGIVEYQIVVAPADVAVSLTLGDVMTLPADTVTTLAASGSDQVVTNLGANTLDSTGEAIGEGVEYRVLVVSVGDDPVNAAIAPASPPVTLAATTVSITYLGNDGIMIDDGERKVVIDGLHAAQGSWIELPASQRTQLEQGQGDYAGVSAVLITHNHGDHYSPLFVGRFLDNHPGATVIGPAQVVGGLAGRPQVMPVSPARGEQVDVQIDGVAISVLHVRHFDQFGNDFSGVENFGYLIEMGGLRLLHLGDVDYTAANLSPFALAAANVDIVFLPTFNTLLSQANADVVAAAVAPGHVVALHFQRTRLASEGSMVDQFYPGATKFTQALQVLRR